MAALMWRPDVPGVAVMALQVALLPKEALW